MNSKSHLQDAHFQAKATSGKVRVELSWQSANGAPVLLEGAETKFFTASYATQSDSEYRTKAS